jgi:hypothetical protein
MAAGAVALSALAWAVSVRTSASAPIPERTLAGIGLGHSFRDVLALYGGPNQILTVAVPGQTTGIPGIGEGMPGGEGFGSGGGFPGMMPGMPGGSGGAPSSGGGMLPPPPGFGSSGGAGGFGPPAGYAPTVYGGGGSGFGPGGSGFGGSGFGGSGFPGVAGGGGGKRGAMQGMMGGSGGGGSPFGPPVLPPAGGGGEGFPGMGTGIPGIGGMMGANPGMGGATTPETSAALLWVYNKPGNVRLEFLINEDGRVAQISVAAPAKNLVKSVNNRYGKPIAVKTARGVTLGSPYNAVVERYNFPERTKLIMGGRFDEAYFTKDYHAAFTFDALKNRKVVRITITLAD